MAKTVTFTKHATDVLAERALEVDWVLQVVQRPDWVAPDPVDPAIDLRFGAITDRGGRILRVVCLETATEIRIISAFLDRGAKRK